MAGGGSSERWSDTIVGGPDSGQARPRRRRRWPWVVLGGLLVALAGTYVAAHVLIGDRVPSGVQVAGVSIGGLRPAAAEARLEDQLERRATRPLTFVYAGQPYRLDPVEAGLTLDAHQTVANAGGGRTWNPLTMLDRLTGPTKQVQPATDVDAAALQTAVDDLADQVDANLTEGTIKFRGLQPVVVEPVGGVTVKRGRAGEVASAAYLHRRGLLRLPVSLLQPTFSGQDLRSVVDDVVDPVVSSPITLALPGQTIVLQPRQFVPALSYELVGGRIVPSIDKA